MKLQIFFQRLSRIFSGVVFLVAIFFASVFFERKELSYNESGRYFDEGIGVIYTEDAMMIYGVVSVLVYVLSFVLFFISFRKS